MAANDESVPAVPGSRSRETPTIRDVARLAEVSIGTASKALNANGRLSLETRAKVLRVARDLGYRPAVGLEEGLAAEYRWLSELS